MAFTRVRGSGITTTDNYIVGVITATKFVGESGGSAAFDNVSIGGSLTVNGDFTTLNTTLREVELLQVDANSTVTAGIITQRGSGDILNLFDNNTEVFSIKDGGNLTLGTTVSNERVHIHTASSLKAQQQFTNATTGTGGGDGLTIGITGGEDAIFWNHENTNVSFATNNTERLRITEAGQLLLGINNAVDGEVDLQIHSATSGNGPILNLTNDTGDCRIFFGQDNSSGSANAQGQIRYNVASNHLTAYTAGDERLRITSAGLVGIGTDGPDHRLHVFQNAADAVVTIESTGNGKHSALEFIRTSSGGDGKGAGSIYVTGNTGASEAKMQFGVGHNISHGQLPRMTIMGNGEVGIGTENPAFLLDVYKTSNDATIRTRTTTAGAWYWADSASTGYYGIRLASSGTEKWFVGSYASHNFQIKDGSASGGTERFTIVDGTGNIGIGTDNPARKVEIFDTAATVLQLNSTNTGGTSLRIQNSGTDKMYMGLAADFIVGQSTNVTDSAIRANGALLVSSGGGNERLRIDSSGRLLQGITSARGNFGNNTSGVEVARQLEGTGYTSASMSIVRNSNDGNDGGLILGKTRATSVGGNTVVQAGDYLGEIMWAGADGTSLLEAARIDALVESGVGNDDMPTALRFSTNSGTTSPTERLRIDSSGNMGLGTILQSDSDSGGAGLKIEAYQRRNTTYWSPDGYYAASLGEVQNTETKIWAAIDSHYSRSSAVSAGIFLSAFHADAGGSACGYTIKNLKSDNSLTFSSVATAGSTGNPAVETERFRIDGSGKLLVNGATDGNAFAGGNSLIIGNTTSGTRSGMTLVSASNTDGGVYFSRGGSSNSEYVKGQLVYNHPNDYFAIYTGGTGIRLKINSHGGHNIYNDNSYNAANLAECDSDQIALNIRKTRNGQTKAIAIGAIGSSDHTGIQAYDTSDDSSNSLRLNPFGGKIGIGCQPDELLHIKSSTNTPPLIEIEHNTGTAYKAQIGMRGNDLEIRGSNGQMEFYTGNADGASSTERMRIKDDGKVGMSQGANVPLQALHILDNHTSNWDTSINKSRAVLRLETHWNAQDTRAIGDYGSGIAFNHLGGHGTQHNDNIMAFIGLRVHATPGHETSKLVFGTNPQWGNESSHDSGTREAMHIKPDGAIHMAYGTNDVGSTTNIERQKLTIMPSINSGSNYDDNHVFHVSQYNGNWEEGTGGADSCWGLGWAYAASNGSAQQQRAGIAYDHKGTEEFKYWSSYGCHAFYVDGSRSGNETAETCSDCAMVINHDGAVHIGDSLKQNHAGRFQVIHEGGGNQASDGLVFFETNANDWCLLINSNEGGTAAHHHIYFMEEGTARGYISGGHGSNVNYSQGSDYRWKENIVDMTGTEGIDICKKLRPRKYNWIDNRIGTGQINTVDGFIAHEVEEAGVLGAVTGEKDAVKEDGSIDGQALDYGQMTPVLAAAIKGLIAKVETLEAEVAALKSS